MKNKIKTVTIGIPAHNEGRNIGALLTDIGNQRGTNYKIEKVLVACDGCTDNTAEVVQKFHKKYRYITVINDGRRVGQKTRLNEFFKINSSDIFITFDADVSLGNSKVISELVKSFDKEEVGVVGGHDIPKIPTNFIQRIAVAGITLWYETRILFLNAKNAHNLHGCVIAFSKSFIKSVTIPKEIISSDTYLYYAAIDRGFTFSFARKAIVYYTAPKVLNDYLVQSSRFIGSTDEVSSEFNKYFEDHAIIPFTIKIRGITNALIQDPVYVPLSIVFQLIIRIYARYLYKKPKNSIWTVAKSTK
jgi:cellulose synthase/poly-beta-1,6-N-acetylglucosamine synthase-like glycosyltransferase